MFVTLATKGFIPESLWLYESLEYASLELMIDQISFLKVLGVHNLDIKTICANNKVSMQ